jgi:tRNA-2-methylthio-N6-dimethylallyladenosine synthase
VSSDFIVGFCGETDESFQKSMRLIEECRFKNSFIFKYSARTGTKADDLFADDIPEDVKRRRNNEMLDLQNRISEEDNAEFIGRRVKVLVEGPSKSAAKRAAREGQPADGSLLLPVIPAEAGIQVYPSDRIDPKDQHHAHHHDHTEPAHIHHATPEAAALATQLTGRSECDRIVVFDGNPRLIGTTAEIEIHDCTCTTLMGSIVTREVQHGCGLLPVLV